MMKKKVLSLLILLALSFLWLAAWTRHARAYNQLIEKYRERLGDDC